MSKNAAQTVETVVEADLGHESASITRRNAEIAKAFWGYAIHDITKDEAPKLTYGSINCRPVDSSNVTRLANSMIREGTRRIDETTSIPVVVPRSKLLVPHQCRTFSTRGAHYPFLKDVVNESVTEIAALGGQHRRDAMSMNLQWADKTMKTAGDRLATIMAEVALVERALKSEGKRPRAQTQKRYDELKVDEARLCSDISKAKTIQQWQGLWLVMIYVQGLSCSQYNTSCMGMLIFLLHNRGLDSRECARTRTKQSRYEGRRGR